MERRWSWARAKIVLKLRELLGARTIDFPCVRTYAILAVWKRGGVVCRLSCTFCGNVGAPERLPRVLARERQPHELLNHLILRAAGIGVLRVAIELGAIFGIGEGGFGGGRGASATRWGWRGGGFGLLDRSQLFGFLVEELVL